MRSTDDASVPGAPAAPESQQPVAPETPTSPEATVAAAAVDRGASIAADLAAARAPALAVPVVIEDQSVPAVEVKVADAPPDSETDPAGYAAWAKAELETAKARAVQLEAELASAKAVTPPAPAADPTATAPTIRQAWEETKAQLSQEWQEVDAPGERALVEFVENALLPAIDKIAEVSAVTQDYQDQQMRAASAALVHEASLAVAALAEKYPSLGWQAGDQKLLADFIGEMENGGLAAYAAARGITPQSLVSDGKLKKDLFVQAYEDKRWRDLQGKAAEPKGPSAEEGAKKGVPPNLNHGQGSRERREALSREEQIKKDLAEARAGRA